jgi:hypothetical protein
MHPIRHQLIITILLFIVLCAAFIIKVTYFPRLYGHNAYYFISIFWISGSLMVIFLLNMGWQLVTRKKTENHHGPTTPWPNRRETFRIIYPSYLRPMLIVESADNQKLRNLEFPIVDLSQGGCCFLNDGTLDFSEKLTGYIQLDNGNRLKVVGRLVRQADGQVSIQFHRPIEWPTLLEEQRSVMAHLKPAS